MQTMQSCLFAGGRFLDPRQDSFRGGVEVLVEDGLIKQVRDRPIHARSATCIDLRGRTLMLLAAKWCSVAEWAIMLRGRIVKHAL